MPDKITMINFVWMAMIGTMLAATFTLYDMKIKGAQKGVPVVTAHSYNFGEY